MFSLYLFALIVGGALLLFSLFGGSDHADTDFADHGHSPVQWLSVRTLMYFLFVFGGVGAILSKSWAPSTWPIVLGVAVLAGAGVGTAVSAAFGYLRRTDSGYRQTDDSFIGLTGRVTVPLAPGRSGKVLVSRGDRTFDLLAQPYDKTVGATPLPDWKEIIIVEMTRGTAIVAPVDDPAVRELASVTQL